MGGTRQAEQTPQTRSRAQGRRGQSRAGREPGGRTLGRLCPRREGPAETQRQDAAPALHKSYDRGGEPLPDYLRAQRRLRRGPHGRLSLYRESPRGCGAGRSQHRQEHEMHAEYYRVPGEAVQTVRDARRVVAAGTTVARTLETWAASGEAEGESELFVYPGYRWLAVDTLLTNFHLPRSTLLAMVMSFGSEELVKEAYRTAVRERYRFYSFGDAMLLLDGGRQR